MKYPWSLTIKPKDKGFEISIYDDKPYAPNYNLPTEMNEPDYYYAANAVELVEFLMGVYGYNPHLTRSYPEVSYGYNNDGKQ